jgi:hypothetical protein
MIIHQDGKQYNNEIGIISLTSWSARITTVGMTIFSLLKQCPHFHISLCLAVEEFPNQLRDMPPDIMKLVQNHLIEILWVYNNIKSFKKVIPAMSIYKSVPIISADDDCIYVYNYAQQLYDMYKITNDRPINYRKSSIPFCTCGPATLYPPSLFNYILDEFASYSTTSYQDDGFFADIFKKKNVQPLAISNKFPCYFHDETKPLTGSDKVLAWKRDQSYR